MTTSRLTWLREICTMNRRCAVIIIWAFCIAASPTLAQTTCSCTAPDGNCSAAITCRRGCIRFCGINGECWAECTDRPAYRTTTVEIQNGTYSQLLEALRSSSLKHLEFIPTNPDARVDVAFKRAPLWDAFEFLSERGTLRIDGSDFESLRKQRKALLSGDTISLSVVNKPVREFVDDMVFLTGLDLRVTGGRRNALVNMNLRNVTLRQILSLVSIQTGAKIKEFKNTVRSDSFMSQLLAS